MAKKESTSKTYNNMVEGYNIGVGSKILVKNVKSGTKRDKTAWQSFQIGQYKKNAQTGEYDYIGNITFFNDTVINDLTESKPVKITAIKSLHMAKNLYNGKTYHQVIVNGSADLFTSDENQTSDPFSFDQVDVDGLEISDEDLNF